MRSTTPSFPIQMDLGRFYSAGDMQLRAFVLGSESKEKLFSGRFPLGERVRINGMSYEVVGTENSINRVMYIPFPTLSDFRHTHCIDMIWLDFLCIYVLEVARRERREAVYRATDKLFLR